MRWVDRPWRTRLASRLALAFFVPAMAVVILAASVAFNEARSALRESAYDRLRAATAVREAQFDRWVNNQASDLRFLSTLPSVRNGAAVLARAGRGAAVDTLTAVLQRAVADRHQFNRIAVLSAVGGRVVATSDSSRLGDYHVTELHFLLGRSQLVVQNVYPSPTTGQPTLTVALPVRDGDGRTVAVLAGDANLTAVEAVIAERAGLGTTGEAYLVDKYHELVRGRSYGRAQYRRGVHTPTIDAAVRGESGAGVYRNYAGTEVIGVYRWLPDRELALFAEMHTAEAFAPARRLAWVILGIGLLAALALAFGVTFLARQIAQPVLEIADAAQAVAGGDLTATAPVRTADEIGQLAVAFNAMTERLRALYGEQQTQLLRTEETARSTEAGRRLLRAVIDNLPALVVVKDLEGRYLLVNEAFATLNGIASPDHALGRTARELLPASVAERDASADALVRAGEPMIGREEIVATAAEERVYLTSRFPLLAEDGRPFALCTVATDITARKRLETQFLHQQKLEAVGRLAGGVAHDINNLLTAVRCNAELLFDGMAGDDPSREQLEEIDRSVRNGAALTRQLLTFSREQVVRPTALDLNRILSGMSMMLRRYVGTGIDMRFAVAPDLWTVYVDGGQVEQVLLNLLSNAHDAMPAGGTAVITTANVLVGTGTGVGVIGDLAPGEYVQLTVRDTGTGIDPQLVPLLFEPFFTTKEAGRGTGLGLSTAYAIVQQARGAITVDSTVGAGTTFAVYLPRCTDEVAAPIQMTAVLPPATEVERETLLVVDDEPAVRTSLRRMLVRHGYRVIEAESGQDALEQFSENAGTIALALIDVFMPGMSGHELATILLTSTPELPIVFMSGYTADEVVRRGLMDSATRFLQKPFERQALVAAVEELLARPPSPTPT